MTPARRRERLNAAAQKGEGGSIHWEPAIAKRCPQPGALETEPSVTAGILVTQKWRWA
jgi:hypothetical protein